ncbi:hypothetical protein [Cupriavidus metallidurans]|uniref:Uncharacterized protein n=1 Tax=Cupriavidus metallidurans (strain ATCC 43123 / DSM 2839 / NBRC 102507 / CH34) TaxID=266264 RepID=Q1LB36_CUPMC|nr:hypothetical protein [Cupriavidus metallidurans]ABF12640.1 hypothetical protein Rmet_5781 [Cupriavidus metallidurans CH34]QGS32166.1 hypothetical protein FOB83_25245 [Cupriavidus metallidurans]
MRHPVAALGIALAVSSAHAQEAAAPAANASQEAQPPAWNFSLAGYWNMPRQEQSYLSAIAIAERDKLHLEARANYEAMHAQSAFVGWSFAGGETFTYKVTPIIGFAMGSIHGVIPGLEASLAAYKFDYYIEAEYLTGSGTQTPSYLYAWSELGYRPVDWLRLGFVMQRTRIYGGDREFQRGGLVQLTFKNVTVGCYWFNPGSSEQVVMTNLTVSF